jgi:lysophospholipase L1-like esterase
MTTTANTTPVSPVTPVEPPAKANPFATVVFLGDSLTAGFQNGSLLDTQQPHGFPSLIGAQAGFAVSLPLIAAPGEPAVLRLVGDGLPPVLAQASGATAGRDNPTVQPTNLGVPGYNLAELINTAPTATPSADEDILTGLVLGYPLGSTRTAPESAIALKPTTIFLWIGNNDALIADVSGSPASMTPLASFNTNFAQLMGTLKASSAHLFVANLPDVTAIPYMEPAAQVIAIVSTATGLTQDQVAQQLGIAAGDLLNPDGVAAVEIDLAFFKPGGTLFPLTDADVLSAAEIATVQSTLDSYNQVIAQQVAAAGGTLVDMHAFFSTLAPGVTINGYNATTSYLGGLFSLDGVHPTNTGYALLANQFITVVNMALSLAVPGVNVSQVAASDPYFGPNIKPTGDFTRDLIGMPALAGRRASLVMRSRQR